MQPARWQPPCIESPLSPPPHLRAGAFTSVCSSKHLPGFNAKYEDLKKAGVDTVCCSSINGEASLSGTLAIALWLSSFDLTIVCPHHMTHSCGTCSEAATCLPAVT
jgi:hypothetical protein